MTLRFGSDRGESLLAATSWPHPSTAPPCQRVHLVYSHADKLQWERVYPSGASRDLVDAVERRLKAEGKLQSSEEWRYGLS